MSACHILKLQQAQKETCKPLPSVPCPCTPDAAGVGFPQAPWVPARLFLPRAELHPTRQAGETVPSNRVVHLQKDQPLGRERESCWGSCKPPLLREHERSFLPWVDGGSLEQSPVFPPERPSGPEYSNPLRHGWPACINNTVFWPLPSIPHYGTLCLTLIIITIIIIIIPSQ